MPKLWVETIDAHKRSVRDAIMATAVALVDEHGLRAVTMAQIAEDSGIGRATLYKYFPDVESILLAWHERQVRGHLRALAAVAEQVPEPGPRLEAVLRELAHHLHGRAQGGGRHHSDLASMVHRGAHVAQAQDHLIAYLRDLLSDAAKSGVVRDDVPPAELAQYCLEALGAASQLPSQPALDRLVRVMLAGLAPGR